MYVRFNVINKVDRSSVEYLCRNYAHYLISIFIQDSIDNSYYIVSKLKKAKTGILIENRTKESCIMLIAINETDPYSFARGFLQNHFSQPQYSGTDSANSFDPILH